MRINDLTATEWIKHSISYFKLPMHKKGVKETLHPAAFPVDLAVRFIEMLTHVGDTVLDPFVGSGSTPVACQNLMRNSVCLDLQQKYVDMTRKRISFGLSDNKQYIYQFDSMNIIKCPYIKRDSISLMITSPPYWDMLNRSRGGSYSQHKKRKEKNLPLNYSEDVNDLGNIKDYHDYILKLFEVFNNCKPFLKRDAFLVIVIQNIFGHDKEFYTPAFDLVKLLGNVYRVRSEQIWIQPEKMAGIWGYPSTYLTNTHHHYCLVFQNNK